jgi:uncharacterized protein
MNLFAKGRLMQSYKQSRFTVAVPVSTGPSPADELLALYHTMTQGFVLLDPDVWQSLAEQPSADHVRTGADNRPDDETIDYLRAQGFLLPANVDESLVYESWMQQQVHDFSTLTSIVNVTRKCNNRCVYCIIDPEAKEMSHKTTWEMDEFYIQLMRDNRTQKVMDDYLGGEPLLQPDIILASAARRHHYCAKNDIDYNFTVTTNGTLLTPAVVSRLMGVGLSGLRVSLAGPADIHDKLRPCTHPGGDYAHIIKNMRLVSGLIPITVECQYDSGAIDYQRLPEMLDDFKRYDIDVEQVTFSPIMQRRGKSRFNCGLGDPEIALELMQIAADYGYGGQRREPGSLCRADFRAMFVFDPDGFIIPCSGLQNGEMAYGHVSRGVDFIAESQLLKRNLPGKCLQQCELLPICMGGCRQQALVYDNDFAGIHCQYDTQRFFLEDYIRDMAREALNDEVSTNVPEIAEHAA